MKLVQLVLIAVAAVGCGQTVSICEVEIDGVPVCVDSGVGGKFCRKYWDGESTKRDDQTCADLGYAEECPGMVEEIGSNYTASHAYSAKSAEDCAATDGKLIADHSDEP